MTKKVLIPLPDNDFDLTEVSVPWQYFREQGFKVTFSTERGKTPQTDPLLITGVIFGQLGAKPEAIRIYRELETDKSFTYPIAYNEINPADYDILFLPGGHAQGMKQYLGSIILQEKVLKFFKLNKVTGAICHGPVVLARTLDEKGRSVLFGRKVTALTKKLERTAYFLTFWKHGRYYRTYPEYVEDEIRSVLAKKNDFVRGGSMWEPFVVEDENLLTARWPQDASLLARKLVEKVNATVKL